MVHLPAGTVTFLVTDVQGFNQLLQLGVHPDALNVALCHHDEVILANIEQYGGRMFETAGDGFRAAFASAPAAVHAALATQLSLRSQQSGVTTAGAGLTLKVRMALHTGTVAPSEVEYTGPVLQKTLHLLEMASGGQVLISRATLELVREDLPWGVDAKDLGRYPLPGLERPEQVFRLVHPDLPADGSLRSAVPAIPTGVSRGEMLHLLFDLHRRLEAQAQRRAFLSVDVVDSSEMKRTGSSLAVEYSFCEFQRWIKDVTQRWGGEFQSAAGDGVMCLFPSDAQALRASRELFEGVARFNIEQNRLPLPFRARCGVSAGEIAVDADESIGQLQSAIIDRAAALQKRAQPGSMLISNEVAATALIELGPLTLCEEPIGGELAYEWRGPACRPRRKDLAGVSRETSDATRENGYGKVSV